MTVFGSTGWIGTASGSDPKAATLNTVNEMLKWLKGATSSNLRLS
jgi:hypothetical protein